jgi:hypothetical protein
VPHAAGFRSSWTLDWGRRYRTAFDGGATYGRESAPRPVLVELWYPRGTSGPAPFDPASAPPPTPRQLLAFLGKAGPEVVADVLERWRDVAPESPIYTRTMFAGSLLHELAQGDDASRARAFYARFVALQHEALGLFLSFGNLLESAPRWRSSSCEPRPSTGRRTPSWRRASAPSSRRSATDGNARAGARPIRGRARIADCSGASNGPFRP